MTHRTRRRRLRTAHGPIELLEERRLLSVSVPPIALPAPLPPGPGGVSNADSASSLVQGPDGNLWFTDQDNNAIGRETPGGSITEYSLPTSDASPDNIISGADGNLWFLETDADQIGRISTTGDVTEFPIPSSDASPCALTAGPGGAWFIDGGNNQVGRITPAGKITEFALTDSSLTLDDGICAGADGNIWAVAEDDSGNGVLVRVTPAGKMSSFPLPATPNDLTAGPDGALWVDCDGEIDRVTTAGVATRFPLVSGDSPYGITGAPDGALWFATYGQNSMGRITTDGAIAEFAPSGLAQYGSVNALASGPGGQVWYATDSPSGNSPLVSFDPHNALLAGGTNSTATAGTSSTVVVASFIDLSADGAASDFKANIDWGDGTTSDGVIAPDDQGGFQVSGTHTWGIGSSDVTVTITDIRPASADPGGLAGRMAVAQAAITSPAPQAQGTGVDISALAGQLFDGVVAHYTNVLLDSLSSYSANIDWGDGHYTAGVVAADGQGGFSISGSNRFASSGTYTITTNLWPWSFGPILPIAVAGGGGGVVAMGGVVSGASAGQAVGGSGGTNSSLPNLPVPDPLPLPGPEGTTSTATVAPGVMDGTGFTLLASSKDAFNNIVASFQLTDPTTDLSHFHATVIWNDPGTFDWFQLSTPQVTDAPITPDGQGGFTVSVSSSFPQYGWHRYQVLISDDRLGTGDDSIVGAAYGQVIVDTPIRPIPVATGVVADGAGAVSAASATSGTANPALSEHVKFSTAKIARSAGKAFGGNVGILTGVLAGTPASALSGTINWGDGTTSVAQFVVNKKGKIRVRGAHTYASAGSDAVTISMTQSLFSNGAPTADPPIQLPQGRSIAHISHGRRHAGALLSSR